MSENSVSRGILYDDLSESQSPDFEEKAVSFADSNVSFERGFEYNGFHTDIVVIRANENDIPESLYDTVDLLDDHKTSMYANMGAAVVDHAMQFFDNQNSVGNKIHPEDAENYIIIDEDGDKPISNGVDDFSPLNVVEDFSNYIEDIELSERIDGFYDSLMDELNSSSVVYSIREVQNKLDGQDFEELSGRNRERMFMQEVSKQLKNSGDVERLKKAFNELDIRLETVFSDSMGEYAKRNRVNRF